MLTGLYRDWQKVLARSADQASSHSACQREWYPPERTRGRGRNVPGCLSWGRGRENIRLRDRMRCSLKRSPIVFGRAFPYPVFHQLPVYRGNR